MNFLQTTKGCRHRQKGIMNIMPGTLTRIVEAFNFQFITISLPSY
jgi:hypothetical protein